MLDVSLSLNDDDVKVLKCFFDEFLRPDGEEYNGFDELDARASLYLLIFEEKNRHGYFYDDL